MSRVRLHHLNHYELAEWDVRLLLAARSRLEEWTFDNLAAPYWRLYHSEGKGAFVRAAGKKVPLETGFVYLIPPNTPYSSWLDRAVTKFYIHFTVNHAFKNEEGLIYRFEVTGDIRKILRELRVGRSGAIHSQMMHVLVRMGLSQLSEERWDRSHFAPQVEKAIALMKSSLSRPLDNTAIGRQVSLHPNSFIRMFSRNTGISPQSYLTQLRLDESCRLLHHTTMSIDEIAEATGFCDRFHFSRVFKKTHGIAPAAFRRQVQPR